MLTIFFILLAGFFKAVADTLQHHFDTSIFKRKYKKFWDPAISWQFARYLKFTRYKVDAWHLSNSGMVIAFCLAIVCHHAVLHWFFELLLAGLFFNVTFNIFYNKVLR